MRFITREWPWQGSICRYLLPRSTAPDGSIWLASEYIPGGNNRDFYANWGTCTNHVPP